MKTSLSGKEVFFLILEVLAFFGFLVFGILYGGIIKLLPILLITGGLAALKLYAIRPTRIKESESKKLQETKPEGAAEKPEIISPKPEEIPVKPEESSAKPKVTPAKPEEAPAKPEETTAPEKETLYSKYYEPLLKRLKTEQNGEALQALHAAIESAMEEVRKNVTIEGKSHSPESFREIPEQERIEYALSIGARDVRESFLYLVSMSEIFPYCDALFLLMLADHDPLRRSQTVGAGDGADVSILQKAVDHLKVCCPEWNCMVMSA
nr:hypothetical protein [Lachnospiraceae bacterium]